MKTKSIYIIALSALFVTRTYGQTFTWAQAMGGSGLDGGNAMVMDAAGNTYTAGYFNGTSDFNPGTGVFNLTSAGANDIFVCKLDSTGNFVWAKQMGGTGVDVGSAIAVDASGNVHIAGGFEGTADFDPGSGTSNLTASGGPDVFVSKLDASGNFVWAIRMGGTNVEDGASVAVDAAGNVYTTGYFQGTADFDPGAGATNLTSSGGSDIFVSKLDASGNFVWVKQMVGVFGDYDYAKSLAVDNSGNIYFTGNFTGTTDFDPGVGVSQLNTTAGSDIFVAKLDASGNFVWAKQMVGVGTSGDGAYALTLDATGNVYTTGFFQGTVDFDPGAGTSNVVAAGDYEIFVSKLDASGNFVWAKAMGGNYGDRGYAIAVDASSNVYTTGYFTDVADFDPGTGTFNLTALVANDVFISKLDASGNFVWAKSFGGAGGDAGSSVKVDATGNVYTAGTFEYTVDFDPGTAAVNISGAGASDAFVHKMSQTGVGITENEKLNIIHLFPNPTAGKVFISNPNNRSIKSLEIYNGLGEKVLQQQKSNEIDLSVFPEGLYFVNINIGTSIFTNKIIVQQ